MGVGLEELKEARFSPLFYAGKNYKKLYVFSNDKGTLLLKKKIFNFDHDTLPLNDKAAYKRGKARPKRWRPEVKNGCFLCNVVLHIC